MFTVEDGVAHSCGDWLTWKCSSAIDETNACSQKLRGNAVYTILVTTVVFFIINSQFTSDYAMNCSKYCCGG